MWSWVCSPRLVSREKVYRLAGLEVATTTMIWFCWLLSFFGKWRDLLLPFELWCSVVCSLTCTYFIKIITCFCYGLVDQATSFENGSCRELSTKCVLLWSLIFDDWVYILKMDLWMRMLVHVCKKSYSKIHRNCKAQRP